MDHICIIYRPEEKIKLLRVAIELSTNLKTKIRSVNTIPSQVLYYAPKMHNLQTILIITES